MNFKDGRAAEVKKTIKILDKLQKNVDESNKLLKQLNKLAKSYIDMDNLEQKAVTSWTNSNPYKEITDTINLIKSEISK